MKKLLLILLCLPIIGFGQGWKILYENHKAGFFAKQTIDGGFIIEGVMGLDAIVGSSNSDALGSPRKYLMKCDANGQLQWSWQGDNCEGYERSLVENSTGDYIYSSCDGNWLSWTQKLQKMDSNGNILWTQYYPLRHLHSIQQTLDGGYILCKGDSISGLLKIDANGVDQWTKEYDTLSISAIHSVQQTSNGGYIFISDVIWTPPTFSSAIINTDINGNIEWISFSPDSTGLNSVMQTSDGGYIFTGIKFDDQNNREIAVLFKTDSIGNHQWNKLFSPTIWSSAANFVQQTTDGGYIVAGHNWHANIIKTDGNGIEQWRISYDTLQQSTLNSIQPTSDGGYILCGEASIFTSTNQSFNNKIYLIKIDAYGSTTSTFTIPINPNRKLQKTVDLLGRESKPQKNIPFIEIYDDGTVEKKITID